MIGIDTNVLVRFITKDDKRQYQIAKAAIGRLGGTSPGYVSLVTLIELCWVLGRTYKYQAADIYAVVDMLLGADEITVDRHDCVSRALNTAKRGAGLADALIELSGRDAGCKHTVTFDQGAAKNTGMRLLT